MNITRRELLQQLALASAAGAWSAPPLASPRAAGHEKDWDWLTGNWDVYHERLRDRLVGSNTWDKFAGKSSFWHTLGGLGNVDDNLLELPSGTYRAISARTFDPATAKWAIWWLDGRIAGKLDPPVRGGFAGDEGEFIGNDVYKGTPVVVRFRWHETHGKRPWWDQTFSTEDGKTSEINWRNYFTRTSAEATPIPIVGEPRCRGARLGIHRGRLARAQSPPPRGRRLGRIREHAHQPARDGRFGKRRRQRLPCARRHVSRHEPARLRHDRSACGAAGG